MKHQDCVSCGAANDMTRFEDRSFEVEYRNLRRSVQGLSGWECRACGETEFDPDSALRYGAAGDQLIETARRTIAQEMKRIRRKLSLTQKTAVQMLSGGGHNAFSRYERGEVEPPRSLVVLMALLDRHPQLMEEIVAINQDVRLDPQIAAQEPGH